MRAFNHLLGESSVSFFAVPALARKLSRGFPRSLDGAPTLLPLESSMLGRALGRWFEAQSIRPEVVAECEDSALLQVFGADGMGVFPAPSVVEAEIVKWYGVRAIGRVPEVKERFYAISAERRLKHPAVVALTDAARSELFTERTPRGQGSSRSGAS